MTWRVAVDTGGTFTDVALYDEEAHETFVTKVSSVPSDPGQAVVGGIAQMARLRSQGAEYSPEIAARIQYFAHGTTVATNALLEGKGARVGLITTAGFRDLLELGRQRRPKLYDLFAQKPEAMVPRHMRLEVEERVLHDGAVRISLDPEEVAARVRELCESGVDSIAICLLYSYLHPDHEVAIRRVVEEIAPDAFISVSHEVLPEFREFERLSTVVTNSFIGPRMQYYLSRLRENLAEGGLTVRPHVTQSNGGVIPFETAEKFPVRTVLSGPSAGVVGAAEVGAAAGFDNIITFDMGGTSSDVSLVRDGRPSTASGMILDGRPIQGTMIDVNTVGAGGGSIAWIDSGGHLKVGPQSAGADPGPVCYGRGNTEPTVTDANVMLGILNPEELLGGEMKIDASLAHAAIEQLGERLGLSPVETAQGILDLVTANMARAIRVVSVQRGYDPADYVLVPFGGAGPLHSARLAEELGITRTLVPSHPGAMSAIGMLMTDLRTDFARTSVMGLVEEGLPELQKTFEALRDEAVAWLDEEGVQADDQMVRWYLDTRYVGQNYELTVDVTTDAVSPAWIERATSDFHDAHRLRFGYNSPEAAIEAVTFRVEATGAVPHIKPVPVEGAWPDPGPAQTGTREVYLRERGGYLPCPVYERSLLRAGNRIQGPALVEQYDTTTLLLSDEHAVIDAHLNILATRTRSVGTSERNL